MNNDYMEVTMSLKGIKTRMEQYYFQNISNLFYEQLRYE